MPENFSKQIGCSYKNLSLPTDLVLAQFSFQIQQSLEYHTETE